MSAVEDVNIDASAVALRWPKHNALGERFVEIGSDLLHPFIEVESMRISDRVVDSPTHEAICADADKQRHDSAIDSPLARHGLIASDASQSEAPWRGRHGEDRLPGQLKESIHAWLRFSHSGALRERSPPIYFSAAS